MNVDMIFAGYKYFGPIDIHHRGLKREYLSKRGGGSTIPIIHGTSFHSLSICAQETFHISSVLAAP
jgi:hypothetical protein